MNGDLRRRSGRSAASPNGVCISGKRHSCRFPKAGTNQGEEDGLQVGAGRCILKYAVGQRSTVNAAVGSDDFLAEASGNGRNGRATGCFQFMNYIVCINNLNAKLPEELGKQALAAGDSACQGNSHDQLLGGGRSDASLGLFRRTCVVSSAKGNLAATRIHETRRNEDEQVTLVRPLAAAAEEASDIRNVA